MLTLSLKAPSEGLLRRALRPLGYLQGHEAVDEAWRLTGDGFTLQPGPPGSVSVALTDEDLAAALTATGYVVSSIAPPPFVPPPVEPPTIPAWLESWFAARFAAALGVLAPIKPVVHPIGDATRNHELLWANQNAEVSADRWGLISNDPTIFPGFATFGGDPVAGEVLGLRLEYEYATYDITHTVTSGQTLGQVAAILVEKINAHAGLLALGTTSQIYTTANVMLVNPSIAAYPEITALFDPDSPGAAISVQQPVPYLDINPYFSLYRRIPGVVIPPRSCIGGYLFGADLANGQGWTHGSLTCVVMDSDPAHPSSRMVIEADEGIIYVRRGAVLGDHSGGAPTGGIDDERGDMGPGTWNVYGGYYVNGQPVAMQADVDALTARVEALETA